MEYVFGTEGAIETLRTKGDAHTDLTGFQQVDREYSDRKFTDYFRIVRKLRSDEDVEGNKYDWYEIDHHNRAVDPSKSLMEKIDAVNAAIDEIVISMLEG